MMGEFLHALSSATGLVLTHQAMCSSSVAKMSNLYAPQQTEAFFSVSDYFLFVQSVQIRKRERDEQLKLLHTAAAVTSGRNEARANTCG